MLHSRAARHSAFIVFAAAFTGGFLGGVAAAGDKALGEYLSSECVTCHQMSGRFDGIPSIVGWPDANFVAIMDEYRQKKRSNAIMQTIASRFSNDELAALAAYFGSLKVRQGIR